MNKSEKRRIESAIWSAIDYFNGSRRELAKAAGVSISMVDHWLYFRAPVSMKKAFKIESVTSGKVKAKSLLEWFPEKLK